MNDEDSLVIGRDDAALRRRIRNNQTIDIASESSSMVPNAHCVNVRDYDEISLPDSKNAIQYSNASNNHRSINKKKDKDSSGNLSGIALSLNENILTDESTFLKNTQCSSQRKTQTLTGEKYINEDQFDSDDRKMLISSESQKNYRFDLEEDHNHEEETSCTIALQISFPFLMAGMGMVAAGLILDKVQVCAVFVYLVPLVENVYSFVTSNRFTYNETAVQSIYP